MARRITQAEKIAKIRPEELGKLSGPAGKKQLVSYLRTLQSGYKRRVGSFKRKGLVSHAQISLERTAPKNIQKVPLTELTRNQLLFEIARYQKFFNSATSSEKGLMEVNREQDKRIFGTDRKGRPLRTMTQSERQQYWDMYEEFRNQFPEWSTQPYSEQTQQTIADALFGDGQFKNLTFAEQLQKAREYMESSIKKSSVEDGPNVFAGRWSGFEK